MKDNIVSLEEHRRQKQQEKPTSVNVSELTPADKVIRPLAQALINDQQQKDEEYKKQTGEFSFPKPPFHLGYHQNIPKEVQMPVVVLNDDHYLYFDYDKSVKMKHCSLTDVLQTLKEYRLQHLKESQTITGETLSRFVFVLENLALEQNLTLLEFKGDGLEEGFEAFFIHPDPSFGHLTVRVTLGKPIEF